MPFQAPRLDGASPAGVSKGLELRRREAWLLSLGQSTGYSTLYFVADYGTGFHGPDSVESISLEG